MAVHTCKLGGVDDALMQRASGRSIYTRETLMRRLIPALSLLLAVPACENTDRRLEVVSEPLVLNVSTAGDDGAGDGSVERPWATPRHAVRFLANRWLSAPVTIQIQSGTYHLDSPLVIDHPCGAKITIEGEGSSETILDFANSPNGIMLTNGACLGGLNRLRLTGGPDKQGRGLLALGNSTAAVGPDLVISSFSDGLCAKDNSHVNCQHVIVEHCSFSGFKAVHRGHLLANYALARSNPRGYAIDDGSYLYGHHAQAHENEIGFLFRNSSAGYCKSAVVLHNKTAFRLQRDCYVNAQDAQLTDNGDDWRLEQSQALRPHGASQ
jgi:hypothetical protein